MITSVGTMEGETRDMSTAGAYIHCEAPLSPAERLLVNVKLPSGSPLQVSAQVVWSNHVSSEEKQKPPGMGVRFLW
jgi:Tfp pilus assembly protein PilZ